MKQLPVLDQASFVPAEPVARPDARFRVEGMDCAACARTVEKAVAALDGVREARVSFGAGSLDLWGEPAPETVELAVSRAGYRARRREERRSPQRGSFWTSDPRALSTLVGIALLAV